MSASYASLTVSAVIFGIALATLPFGRLVDTFPVRPILFTGGFVVIGCSLFCAVTGSLPLLVAARLLPGTEEGPEPVRETTGFLAGPDFRASTRVITLGIAEMRTEGEKGNAPLR